MRPQDILRLRLSNQKLSQTEFSKPDQVVAWLGAVQSQDYSGAKWALCQRIQNATDTSIEQAFADGEILRTHVMRPTWHFVHPQDIRWMLMLTSPRVKTILAHYDRKLGLDEDLFKRSYQVFEKALEGQKMLTRTELAGELQRNGIKQKGQALGHIVAHAELDAVICSGPRKGKQFTYMLLEERVPKTKSLTPEEALTELTKRYFQSHGPATTRDFVWWSGLTTADAKKGIKNHSSLIKEVIKNVEYWFFPSKPDAMPDKAFLLPNYDEYGIAYKERSAFFNPEYVKLLDSRGNATFQHLIVINGQFVGTWKRTLKKDSVVIDYKFFTKPSDAERRAFIKAVDWYAAFLGLSAILS